MLVEQANTVAVWVGTLSQEQLTNYVYEENTETDDPLNQFAADMGEFFYDSDLLDGHHSPNDTCDIQSLLEPLAYSGSFVNEVINAATRVGLTAANCVLALYRQELVVDEWPESSPVVFIGNFHFERD